MTSKIVQGKCHCCSDLRFVWSPLSPLLPFLSRWSYILFTYILFNTILTIVTVLYNRSTKCIHLIITILYLKFVPFDQHPLISPSHLLPPASGNGHSPLGSMSPTFYIPYVSEIVEVPFCVWLQHLALCPSGSAMLAKNSQMSFFFMAE